MTYCDYSLALLVVVADQKLVLAGLKLRIGLNPVSQRVLELRGPINDTLRSSTECPALFGEERKVAAVSGRHSKQPIHDRLRSFARPRRRRRRLKNSSWPAESLEQNAYRFPCNFFQNSWPFAILLDPAGIAPYRDFPWLHHSILLPSRPMMGHDTLI